MSLNLATLTPEQVQKVNEFISSGVGQGAIFNCINDIKDAFFCLEQFCVDNSWGYIVSLPDPSNPACHECQIVRLENRKVNILAREEAEKARYAICMALVKALGGSWSKVAGRVKAQGKKSSRKVKA